MDENKAKAIITQAIGLLQSLIEGEQTEDVFVNTPFGAFFRDREGKMHKAVKQGSEWVLAPPEPPPIVEPEKPTPEVVWPVIDYSDPRYTIGSCKTCVSYHAELTQHGFPGLVAEIRKFWDKKETFYQPIKDFMRDFPELFPCENC